jgi:hypothetical protein
MSPGNCQQRVRLSQEIANAMQRKYKALSDYDRAVNTQQDSRAFVQALAEARTAERVLVAKLAEHQKEHGC